MDIPERPNETWSADFVADALWSGRRFRTFNVIDDFSREGLRIEIEIDFSAEEFANDGSSPSRRAIAVEPECNLLAVLLGRFRKYR